MIKIIVINRILYNLNKFSNENNKFLLQNHHKIDLYQRE